MRIVSGLAHLGLSLVFVALAVGGARADVTSPLPVSGDGAYLQWTPSSGATHYTMLSPSCSATNSLSTSTVGAREALRMAPYTVPMGATITAIEITPCATSMNAGSATLQVFYRLNGVDSADAGSYTLPSGATPGWQAATTFSGLNISRNGSTTIDAGFVLTGGTGGARVSGVQMRLTYSPPAPFNAPTNLAAVNVNATQNNLSWIDNTTTETGFRVQRSMNSPDAWAVVTVTAGNVSSFQDRFLVSDQTYYYRIQALSSVTGEVSLWSNVVTAITYGSAPPAPSNLYMSSSATGISLGWLDLGNNEDGFSVERSLDGTNFVEIAAPGVNAVSYLDPVNGTGGTAYYYRLRAHNPIGLSAYSNTVSNVVFQTQGPDLNIGLTSSTTRIPNSQTTTFSLGYGSTGSLSAPNAYLVATIPQDGTFVPELSAPEWRCHNSNADAFLVEQNIARVLRVLKARYPNLQQVFLTSHHYTGYNATTIAEPFAYEGGLGVKWAIDSQINQMRSGKVDPITGDMSYGTGGGAVPWIAWGPYMWANGLTPNGQGLTWALSDYQADVVHPTTTKGALIASSLLNYFLSSPVTPWFRVATDVATPIVPIAQPGPTPTALIDMRPQDLYRGVQGGLYENATNAIPADHLAAGTAAAARIFPRATNGTSDPVNGKVIMISIGFSNTSLIFQPFITQAAADPRARVQDRPTARTTFKIINGATGGGTMNVWLDPASNGFTILNNVLTGSGYSEAQVQAAWFHSANPAGPWSATPLLSTVAGTRCTLPLGSLANGATGAKAFAVRTAFQRATALNMSVSVLDDGSAGPDLAPPNNSAALNQTITP